MEEEKSREVEIRLQDLFSVFLHCWWVMALVAVVIGVGMFIFMNATHEPVYTATATVYVMKENANTSTAEVSIANTLVKDFMELTKMDRVLELVKHDCGLAGATTDDLRKMVKVENIENTRFIYVSITAKDATSATDIVNSLASNACDVLNNDLLHGQLYASVANSAQKPDEPSNPISKLQILLVAFVCAVLVYAVYLILFLLDDKINTPEDVEKYLGLSLLGQIPNKQDAGRRKKYYAYDAQSR